MLEELVRTVVCFGVRAWLSGYADFPTVGVWRWCWVRHKCGEERRGLRVSQAAVVAGLSTELSGHWSVRPTRPERADHAGDRSGRTGDLVSPGHPGLSPPLTPPHLRLHGSLERRPRILCSHPQVQAGPHRLRRPQAGSDTEVSRAPITDHFTRLTSFSIAKAWLTNISI